MKIHAACCLLLVLLLTTCTSPTHRSLETINWIHGSVDCAKNQDPPIQVVEYLSNTWILRQNKCLNYEAPFMFLFVGSKRALLMDTGATEDSAAFPLYQTVMDILIDRAVELVVAHTHNHSDHYAADKQFAGKRQATVVGRSQESVRSFFGIQNWPTKGAVFDLGDRMIDIIPIPGHEEASIALYDSKSRLLLTGDTFYPGRLYVSDWIAFKESIQRLVDFSAAHEIDYVLGNHIEMSTTPGVDYPVETAYQPEEHVLPLRIHDLITLNDSLRLMGDQPILKVFDHFIVTPIRQ